MRALSLLVAAALAVGVPVVNLGPSSAAPVPRPVDAHLTSADHRTLPVDAAARAGGPAGAESAVVETRGALRVVGVTWPRGAVRAGDRVELRERGPGGWGPWTALDVDDDHAPDAGSPEAAAARGGTEPYVTTAAAVQTRVIAADGSPAAAAVARVGRARLDVVDPRTSPADAGGGAVAGAAGAASAKPVIRTRAEWGANENLRRGSPSYGDVRAAVVHHTAGSNSYTAEQVPAIIRGIYDFHVNGRGWSDVGYNYLIDRFGRIWEGRHGGVERAVVGAHAGGFNSQTFGASTLGDFTSVAPPAAVVAAQAQLTAWRLGLAHVDPSGSAVIDGVGTVPAVMGHRALNLTSCPGARFDALLPSIRSTARASQGTSLYDPTLSATSVPFGTGGTTLTARTSTAVSWRLTVASVCRTDAQFTATGTASTTAPAAATWSGRLADGSPAPPGEYRLTLTATSGTGAAAAAAPVVRTVTVQGADGAPAGFCGPRLAGSDRYGTAAAVARAQDPSSTTVVVVSGDSSAMVDALVSAPLARAKGAVLLLSSSSGLPAATRTEITRRGATTAYLVGGTGVVPEVVRTQLTALGVTTVERVGGTDRYSTAAAVARAMGGQRPAVMVASGSGTAVVDGLVLAGPAAHLGRPVLLVAPDRVPAATRQALTDLGTTSTVVAGGTSVVSDAVLRSLPAAVRLAGSSRYTTATAVGTWAQGVMPTQHVVVASGEDRALVDMLAAGQLGRVTMITGSSAMPDAVRTWLYAAPGLASVVVVGGTGVVSDTVAGLAHGAVLD